MLSMEQILFSAGQRVRLRESLFYSCDLYTVRDDYDALSHRSLEQILSNSRMPARRTPAPVSSAVEIIILLFVSSLYSARSRTGRLNKSC